MEELSSKVSTYLKPLYKILFALALPIFIGSIIVRLFFIIIGKPLSNKSMPLIGIIICFLLGFGICMLIPFLKNIEMGLINATGLFK